MRAKFPPIHHTRINSTFQPCKCHFPEGISYLSIMRGKFPPFHHARKSGEGEDSLEKLPDVTIVSRRTFQHLFDSRVIFWCDNFDWLFLFLFGICICDVKILSRQSFRLLCAFKSQFWGQLQDQMAITYVIIKSIVNHDHDHYYHSDRDIIFRIIAVQPVPILGSQVPGDELWWIAMNGKKFNQSLINYKQR